MWTALALATALAVPGDTPEFKLTNIRATYGLLGPDRKDTKILPGDNYCIAFDIEGIKADEDGKVAYRWGLEVTNKEGKRVYTQEPHDVEVFLTLGGSTVQSTAMLSTTVDQAPGEYTAKVTVRDLSTKAKQEFTRNFEILPKDFGIVRIQTTCDADAKWICQLGGVAGQYLWLQFAVVGFDRDDRRQQPDVQVEMRVLDENRKPTVAKPFVGGVNDRVTRDVLGIPMKFVLALNRPGKYTVELQATDRVSKKKVKKLLPLLVGDTRANSVPE